jgi:hypothetical protein
MQNRRPKHSNEHSHPLTLPCIRNPGAMTLRSASGASSTSRRRSPHRASPWRRRAAQRGAIALRLTRATGIFRRGNGLKTYITFGLVTVTDANGSSTFIVEIE